MQPDELDRFPCRKSPRLPDYDYSSPNYYFITICTHEKQCIFGAPEKLNCCGQIAKAGLDQIPLHFPSVEVDKYVVMPNHIHAIIVLNKHNTDLSVVMVSISRMLPNPSVCFSRRQVFGKHPFTIMS